MSRRKGCGSEVACAFYCSPSVNTHKLSPGWNNVALLTFVRNSPCSCPFSVSLHPPQAALNSEPRKRWSLLVCATTTPKLSPFTGKVAVSVSERSKGGAAWWWLLRFFSVPPQSRLTPCQLPRLRWSLLVRFTTSYIKPALKGEVAMSDSELTEGLCGVAVCLAPPPHFCR